MKRGDAGDEGGLGLAHVLDRLAGNGIGQETDEIAGMAGGERRADLAMVLHAADAGAVARARIDHDDGRLARVARPRPRAARTRNEAVIDGAQQLSRRP